ncbi:hypothetical protein [Microvirga alba]|uniref:Uncharacterized protein n=1 Tax=Microvirga alba TaxID=2791025 RepID=A0A931BS47_9HYPH|nr:hypothetical protein [Microvirga alba]MBF9234699.1 hypothetical protein [Microvirga alba]
MTRWFRHYTGLATDPKFGGIARRAKATRERVVFVWCYILESASETQDGGAFDNDADAIADVLGCETESVAGILAEMARMGMIEDGRVCRWSDRQYESDTSTERSRKSRQRKRNGDATLHDRCATPPDTETDTDITLADAKDCADEAGGDLIIVAEAHSNWPKDAFAQFYGLYPRKVGKPDAEKALGKVRKSGRVPFAKILSGLRAYLETNPDPQFIPHPATWLNKGRWEDEHPTTATIQPRGGPHEQPHRKSEFASAFDRIDERFERLASWGGDSQSFPDGSHRGSGHDGM